MAGFYFVTVCCWRGECLLGEINSGGVELNQAGKIALDNLKKIENIFKEVNVLEFMIMPNHINIWTGHCPVRTAKINQAMGIGQCPVRTRGNYGLLSKIINGYKGATTKRIKNESGVGFGWHRSFYDRIVRNKAELERIRQYIRDNPKNWEKDRNYKKIISNRIYR